jgi:hypothetical protein
MQTEEERKRKRKIYEVAFREAHPDIVTARLVARREKRPPYNKKYYEDNRERMILRAREYRKNNPEKVAASQKEYDAAHRQERAALSRKWSKAHPEKVKVWNRQRALKNKYGITTDEYDAFYKSQDGKCAICGCIKPEPEKCFAVDHNHNTGNIRGLLCSNCNTGIGMLQDNSDLLRIAADYLEKI